MKVDAKNKNIVISGYYGFGNTGDEAMLQAIIDAMRVAAQPIELEFTVISGDPEATILRHKVNAIYRFDVMAIIKTLLATDLLISGGGSLLQDVTSKRSIYYYLGIIALAKMFFKPVMLYAQGIGPIRAILARLIMRLVINLTDVVTVRDEGSFEELKDLHIIRPQCAVTADPVLGIKHQETVLGRSILQEYGILPGSKIVGISVRDWKSKLDYKLAIADLLDKLYDREKISIVFLAMQRPSDVEVSNDIIKLMRSPACIIDRQLSVDEFLSITGCFSVLIAIRLHALIFGAIMSIPLVGISYDPKVQRFLASINQKCSTDLKNINSDDLLLAVLKALNNKPRAKTNRISVLQTRALHNACLAWDLINK